MIAITFRLFKKKQAYYYLHALGFLMNLVQKNWLSSFGDTTRQTPSRKSQYEQARAENIANVAPRTARLFTGFLRW